MSKKDFEDFLDSHKESAVEQPIDWDLQKQEWLDFIKQFYSCVSLWLEPYVKNEKIKLDYKKIELTEDYIGRYETQVMVIEFAKQQITLTPIGTLLIGTKGRIDMEGARGRVQFILADKDSKGIKISISIGGEPKTEEVKIPEWTWKIVLREPRKISYEDLNEENFFNALMEVANG